MDNLIGFAGYALQWLRAFPWWHDHFTFLAGIVFAVISVLAFPHPEAVTWQQMVGPFLGDFLKIMGGLGIAMLGSHDSNAVKIAPKYNQFSDAGTGQK